MFESASAILSHYIKIEDREPWRFDIYSIHVERGENPEDLYYLCNVRNAWFIVLETDYIFSLSEAAKEAAAIFGSDEIKIIHWLAKREGDKESVLSLEAAADKAHYDQLVLDVEGSYLRWAVLALEARETPKRYDPEAYGGSA